MGDRAYTRFSIPVYILTPERRDEVAEVFSISASILDRILAEPPAHDEASYENGPSHRLVQGVPCLVVEHQSWNHGGSLIESELHNRGIPYLRLNETGYDYGPSQSVYDGEEAIDIRLDRNGYVIIGVHIDPNGTVLPDEEEISEVRRFVAASKKLLTAA